MPLHSAKRLFGALAYTSADTARGERQFPPRSPLFVVRGLAAACPLYFCGGHCQECPDDPGVVLSRMEDGLAICIMPDGVCAGTSECEQFVAYYQRCLKPFQPFVIGEGFANSTVLSVIAACRRPRLKQASGLSVAPSCFLG